MSRATNAQIDACQDMLLDLAGRAQMVWDLDVLKDGYVVMARRMGPNVVVYEVLEDVGSSRRVVLPSETFYPHDDRETVVEALLARRAAREAIIQAEAARRAPEREAIAMALGRARATMARSGLTGDYSVALQGRGWTVRWEGKGSRRDIDQVALHQAAIELELIGFEAPEVYGFSFLPVMRGTWSEIGQQRDGEAAVHNAEPAPETVAEDYEARLKGERDLHAPPPPVEG